MKYGVKVDEKQALQFKPSIILKTLKLSLKSSRDSTSFTKSGTPFFEVNTITP